MRDRSQEMTDYELHQKHIKDFIEKRKKQREQMELEEYQDRQLFRSKEGYDQSYSFTNR